MSKKNKKSNQDKGTQIIILITSVLNLIRAIFEIIKIIIIEFIE